jgi:Reverse transcriptase (RNA-dependent DNA polymerase)
MPLTQDFAESCPYSLRRLNLYSVRRLERLLGLSRNCIRAAAASAGRHYSPFEKLSKPKPFQRNPAPPKRRRIDNPSTELKKVQSLIAQRLLRRVSLPPHICGGIKGKNVLDNAVFHRNLRVLLKIDIKRFFPSITNKHVYAVWRDLLNCSPEISGLLTKLTTFERHLPQGAPSSTMLANLVLYSCDGAIRDECCRRSIQYSSWIGDSAFSSDDPRPVINVVISVLREGGFRISRKKLEIAGPASRKILNGVVLGRRFGIPPDRLSRIRSGIHKLCQGYVQSAQIEGYVRSLRGSISQIKPINAKKAESLGKDLEAACKRIGY